MSEESDRSQRYLRHLQPLQGALEAFCRRSLWDLQALEDVLQSTITKTFRDFDLYAEGTYFRAWVFRYLNLEILTKNREVLRNRQAGEYQEEPAVEQTWEMALEEPLLDGLLEDPYPILDRCDDALAAAVRELNAVERSSLLLHVIGEFKYREIAEILEMPIGSVMSAISRGRHRLRRRLADFGRQQGLLGDRSLRRK